MKWKASYDEDIRYIRVFALIPTRHNGYWYWLETFIKRQVYIPYLDGWYDSDTLFKSREVK